MNVLRSLISGWKMETESLGQLSVTPANYQKKVYPHKKSHHSQNMLDSSSKWHAPLHFLALLNFCCQSFLPTSLGAKFSNSSVTSRGHDFSPVIWLFVYSLFSVVPVFTFLSSFHPSSASGSWSVYQFLRPHSLSHIFPVSPSPPLPSPVSSHLNLSPVLSGTLHRISSIPVPPVLFIFLFFQN